MNNPFEVPQWVQNGLEPPVIAGLNAVLEQAGQIVGWATNVRINEDYELQGMRTLGFHGDRGFKSMGYRGRMTVGSFVVKKVTSGKNAEGAVISYGDLGNPLKTPQRTDFTTINYSYTFKVFEAPTIAGGGDGKELFVIQGAKLNTKDINVQEGQIINRDTEWFFVSMKENAKNVAN